MRFFFQLKGFSCYLETNDLINYDSTTHLFTDMVIIERYNKPAISILISKINQIREYRQTSQTYSCPDRQGTNVQRKTFALNQRCRQPGKTHYCLPVVQSKSRLFMFVQPGPHLSSGIQLLTVLYCNIVAPGTAY